MSNLPITFKKLFTENPSSSNISLCFWFEDPKANSRNEGAGIFISLTGPEEFDGKTASEFVWDSFREDFFYSEDLECGLRLKRAVKSSQKRLQDLITNEDYVKEQGVDLHLVAIAVNKGNLYLSLIGSPEVLLARKDKLVDLSDLVPPYEGVGYRSRISVGSFNLEDEDSLLISTPELLGSFKESLDVDKWIGEEGLAWSRLLKELDLFEDNLSGSQYIWVLGYKIPQNELDTADGFVSSPELQKTVDLNGTFSENEIDENAEVLTSINQNDFKDGNLQPKDDSKVLSFEKERNKKINKLADILNKAKGKVSIVVVRIKPFFKNIGLPKKLPTFNVKSLLRNIGSKLDSLKFKGKEKKMFVRSNRLANKRTTAIKYIVFVLGLLALSTYLVINQRNKVVQTQIEEDFNEISTKVDEATAIWKKDRTGAEELVVATFILIDEVDRSLLDDSQLEDLENYQDSAQQVLDNVNRVTALKESNNNISILFDSYLKINESSNITDIAYKDGDIYIVDEATHAIYKYNLTSGAIEVMANSEEILKQPKYLTFGEDRLFVYDVKEGIVSMDLQVSEESQEFKIMPELSARNLGEVEEIGAFSGNVYILVKDEARILKSYPAGSGYSYPEEYFRNGAFDKASDLLIDGNIYVLSGASERIYKYYAGQIDNFELSGFKESLGTPSCGVTGLSDTWPLYVFDSSNSKIVSIEKATATNHPGLGVLTRQYEYRGEREDIFNDVKEILVDEEQQYLYVLDGTRLLRVSLAHE